MDGARILIRVNGRTVLEILAIRNMNVQDLAEKTGLDYTHTLRLVKGEKYTTPGTAKRIQKALAPAQWHDLFALASTGTNSDERSP